MKRRLKTSMLSFMVNLPSMLATAHGLTLQHVPDTVKSVDIYFDDHRVWSLDLRSRGRAQEIVWPEALAPYLVGQTTLRIVDSASGTEIASTDVAFTQDASRVSVVNGEGVQLSLNKWLRLAPDLTAIGEAIQELILDRTEEIIGVLQEMGLRPFLVGGTLLGGVRDGELLPHDDDADVAYLSEHTNPFDVAVEGFRVGRRLEELGYTLMRHSATHMQLHFHDDLDHADYYIDVFAAFFTDDGHINQPFHVRGEMGADDMLPFGTVEISGRPFPAPRDTERWLTINYDADWRTPIPGFEIVTPEPTRRRFQNWFGSYNFGRHFWNAWYGETGERSEDDERIWRHSAEWILSQRAHLSSPQMLELGAGDGSLSVKLATAQREVIATDYARDPLDALSRLNDKNVRSMHLNLFRLTTLAAPHDAGVTGRFDVVANHVLEQVPDTARRNALRLMRLALRSGGSALATMNTQHATDLSPEVPPTWHLTVEQLQAECAEIGLTISVEHIRGGDPHRKPVGVCFTLSGNAQPVPEEVTVKQMVKRVLLSLDPRATKRRVSELTQEVEELRAELDEYRSHSHRVAELIELAETRFGSTQDAE